MNRPNVSVIIPVYNAALYLDECVSSVVASSLREIEVLLVNDGSTDDSLILCKKWGERDSRIQVHNKRNGGLSDARNYGLAHARGEFIAFVDSDDKIKPHMLEDMYNVCQQYDCKIGICGIILWRPSDKKQTEVRVDDLPGTSNAPVTDMNYADYAGMYHNTAWRKIYHRTLFFSGVKFPRGLYHEDVGFWWIMMAQVDRLAIINKPLYYYRQDNKKSICSVLDGRRRANDTILSLAYGLRYGQRFVLPGRERGFLDAFLRTYLKTAYPVDISRKAMLVHRKVMQKLRSAAQDSDRETREMFFSKFCFVQEEVMLRFCIFRDLRCLNFSLSISIFGVNILKLQFGHPQSNILKT